MGAALGIIFTQKQLLCRASGATTISMASVSVALSTIQLPQEQSCTVTPLNDHMSLDNFKAVKLFPEL